MLTGSCFTLIVTTILFIISQVLCQMPQKAPLVTVDSPAKLVRVGGPFEFICRATEPITDCAIEYNMNSESLILKENSKMEKYAYAGKGFNAGDCGVRFQSAEEDMNGEFTCIVSLQNIAEQGIASTFVTVTAPPKNIKLTNMRQNYEEGDQLNVICTVKGGNPTPTINYYLGSTKLDSAQGEVEEATRSMTVEVKITRKVSIADNNKILVCNTTQSGMVDSIRAEQKIVVLFKPQPISGTGGVIQKGNFLVGREGIVSIDVMANPKPQFEWEIDGQIPNPKNYVIEESQIGKNGSWSALMRILNVSKEDLVKEFQLNASNSYGHEIYKVKILAVTTNSTSSVDTTFRYILPSMGLLLIFAIIITVSIFACKKRCCCFAGSTGGSAILDLQEQDPSMSSSLQRLLRNLDSMLEESDSEFSRLSMEFQKLAIQNHPPPEMQPGKYSTALLPQNKDKNRCNHVLPYEVSRVKLESRDSPNSPDYINASYITGYSGQVEYIATQAPLPKTIGDFWNMVFENNVCIIVMATKFFENGMEKCHKYFPNEHCGTRYGNISVECTSHKDFPHFAQSTFKIKGFRGCAFDSWDVVHVHIKDWSDADFPNKHNMIEFFANLRELVASSKKKLVLVHCSVGVGRTATLIAIDILLQEIKANSTCDIFKTVSTLRKQRMNMVQTEAQYKFIHECLRLDVLRKLDTRYSEMPGGPRLTSMRNSGYFIPSDVDFKHHIYDYPIFTDVKSSGKAIKAAKTPTVSYLTIYQN